jgi:predicted transcriptional regulator
MPSQKERIRLNLSVSPELNDTLEHLAEASDATKTDILRRAIALFDVISQAKREKKRIGIFDEQKHLETEIVGF